MRCRCRNPCGPCKRPFGARAAGHGVPDRTGGDRGCGPVPGLHRGGGGMSLIRTEGLSVRIGRTQILSDVDFAIERGEIVTIVGPNGSGKSTLLRALIGAVPLSRGHVRRAPGLRIGYVPQRLHIDPTLPMTVMRFLALPRRRAPGALRAALDRAGLPDLRHRQMADLSGGQFQRVLLARALMDGPDLLILDEATQGLDQPGSAAFYRRIEEVRQD